MLEVGCGPGNITRYILSKRSDLKVLATDMAEKMIELARKNNPSAECIILDARLIKTIKRQFDGIISGFCVPYLNKEEVVKFFQDGYELLTPGGIFYFSAVEGDYSKSDFQTGSTGDRVFMHYYDEGFFSSQLRSSGFEHPEVFRKPYPGKDGSTQIHLVLICRRPE